MAENIPTLRSKYLPESKLADNSNLKFQHLTNTLEEDCIQVGATQKLHPFGKRIFRLLKDFPDGLDIVTEGGIPPCGFVRILSADFPPPKLQESDLHWVDKVDQLENVNAKLKLLGEFGVDTEQHTLRSFLGFTALIQISTEKEDFLIDAIKLRNEIGILREVFADEKIVKIFHGADSDILWLQRDFHIYVVNLFDTARACTVLQKPYHSLLYLLREYCGEDSDKSLQVSEWAQRPLSEAQIKYAQKDAHFLPYLAARLRGEMVLGSEEKNLFGQFWKKTQELTMGLYEKEVFSEAQLFSVLGRAAKNNQPVDPQFRFSLWEILKWRDKTAREDDESPNFVLSVPLLISLAQNRPKTVPDVLSNLDDPQLTSPESYFSILEKSTREEKAAELASVLSKEVDLDLFSTSSSSWATSKKPFTAGKRNKEASRAAFIKKYSCQKKVYENCRIYGMDGRLLCFCDQKKLDWYLKKGLACPKSPPPSPSIKLTFEARGSLDDPSNNFYLQKKDNLCVACGDHSHFLRYRIVPSCYRVHFPTQFKSHRSHDIVLLCTACLEVAQKAAQAKKREIATRFNVPLIQRTSSHTVDNKGSPPPEVMRAALALKKYKSTIPKDRKEELEKTVMDYFGVNEGDDGGKEIDFFLKKIDDIAKFKKEKSKRKNRNLSEGKKIEKNFEGSKKDNLYNAESEGTAVEDFEDSEVLGEEETLIEEELGNPRRFENGHFPHGQKVVAQILKEESWEGLRAFVRFWREAFLEALNPKFLPQGWNVAHRLARFYFHFFKRISGDSENLETFLFLTPKDWMEKWVITQILKEKEKKFRRRFSCHIKISKNYSTDRCLHVKLVTFFLGKWNQDACNVVKELKFKIAFKCLH